MPDTRRIILNQIERGEVAVVTMDSLLKSYENQMENHLKGGVDQVERAIQATIQDRATAPDEGSGVGLDIFARLVRAGALLPPWWSSQRDLELRRFWKTSDHMGGAVYALESKISTVDFKVVPADPSVLSQVRMAEERRRTLLESPEYGKGWQEFIGKWVEDILTQDNGAFAEIIGAGRPDGPIIGAPISLANLDPSRCHRTSNPTWPVVYWDTDGKRYRIHRTRVMFASQMPSTLVEMHGVGFSAVSRAVNVAQNLIDITTYKMEQMGSRPPRKLLVGEKGITAGEIMNAFATSEEMDNSIGLSRFRRLVAIAPKQGRGEIRLALLDLTGVPEGFSEQESVTLGMFAIALAFGVDARELWPATSSGATKADAAIQHLKARGKGPGQIMQQIERQLNQKFLPQSLTFTFDFQDDEQDAMQAEIRDVRSQRHERDVNDGVVTIRAAREQMLADGDVTEAQFEAMELADGRLPSGDSVLSLFYAQDPDIKSLLNLNLDNALDFGNNELRETVVKDIDKAILGTHEAVAQEGWSTRKQKARQALAALEYLKEKWEESELKPQPEPQPRPVGRPRERTQADAERVRNEDDYRGEAEINIARSALGKK